MILALTVGSIVLMWLGELITEKGIGNGISFIIFAGIVSRMPGTVGSFLVSPNWLELFAFGIVGLVIIFVIIFVQEGQRRIPIQYANRVRGHRIYQGGSTFLPLRVNMAGVIPIIFADQHPALPAPDCAVLQDVLGGRDPRHRERNRLLA